MTETEIGYAKYLKTLRICPICKHHIHDMEKHLQTEEHERNTKRLNGDYDVRDSKPVLPMERGKRIKEMERKIVGF